MNANGVIERRMRKATERAIELGGGPTAFGAAIGVSKQLVGYWKRRGRIPWEYMDAIEGAFPEQVTRQELRPDIYSK